MFVVFYTKDSSLIQRTVLNKVLKFSPAVH